MVVPVVGWWLAAVAGGLLVLTVWGSVIGTLIVPRPVGSRLTRWVDRLVNGAFSLATTAIADYRRRDRVLVRQAAAILLMQLVAWLGVAFLGYGLLLWPLVPGGLGSAFIVAGSSLFTLGFREPAGAPSAIVFVAAATGLVIVAWFAILFTSRYPRGMFDFMEGVIRWHNRVIAYAWVLVTDRYPPFRLTQ